MTYYPDFTLAIRNTKDLMEEFAVPVDPGHWQGVSTEGHPDLVTMEMMNARIEVPCPASVEVLRQDILPNLPWADMEFDERVGGEPHNPHESLEHWPWWQGQEEAAMIGGVFSHTYSERFWPKHAGEGDSGPYRTYEGRDNFGIRYEYGDLNNLVDLLLREPHTRQAYCPIWFPEDTGAVHGGRVPCSLGYYFLLRNDKLHMWYTIRSCDLVRHFRDDLYLAARLQLWVLDELKEKEQLANVHNDGPLIQRWADTVPGTFHFQCYSLHYHKGDQHLVGKS